ncbi:putative sporulation protein YtxC [Senegalia massiliensis]|uniref:putative sporulation protein YtxC n=1 Tax=Senegalia massiliensis TaxID=1720316 RepID=UPI001030B24B|nr:putative sporulation protein YtxC [Senegalia massiliensis]
MYCLTIEYNSDICDVLNILNNKFKFIDSIADIKKIYNKIGELSKLSYFIDEKENEEYIKKIINDNIASELSDLILENYQFYMIKKELANKDIYFKDVDIDNICNKSLYYIEKEYKDYNLIKPRLSKKAKINKLLLDYLSQNNCINIEGFINFRLKFLRNFIKSTVDDIIQEFILEKEFEDFINMLKYFMEIQTPKFEIVNIFFVKDGYLLYDNDMKIIDNNYLKQIAEEMEYNEMGYDDLLISSLITIAPKKVIVHLGNRKQDDVIQIIKSLFDDNVLICEGCNLCSIDEKIDIHKQH